MRRLIDHSTCMQSAGGGLFERKIVVVRVAVVKFRVDNRGSNGTGCFRIRVRTDKSELTNVRIAGLRK